MADPTSKPPLDTPQANGLETSDRKDPMRNERREAPVAPKTSGASAEDEGLSRSPSADRNTDKRRHAGLTPRPTDKPISG